MAALSHWLTLLGSSIHRNRILWCRVHHQVKVVQVREMDQVTPVWYNVVNNVIQTWAAIIQGSGTKDVSP